MFTLWMMSQNTWAVFEGSECPTLEIKSLLLHSLLYWSVASTSLPSFYLLDMFELCNLIDWCTATRLHLWCSWVFSFWLINFPYLSTNTHTQDEVHLHSVVMFCGIYKLMPFFTFFESLNLASFNDWRLNVYFCIQFLILHTSPLLMINLFF